MLVNHKPGTIKVIVLTLIFLPILACAITTPDSPVTPLPTEIPATQEARQTEEAVAQATSDYEIENYIIEPGTRNEAMANPDEKMTFIYEGEHQSYHTGLRNRTVFFIDYDSGVVVANEEDSFEEGSGELIRRGTDTITFSGWYHSATNTFQGKLRIHTQGTAVGYGDQSDWTNTVTYTMNGDVMMWKVGGEWSGHVEGTSTLKQSWPSGRYSDEITTHNIYWEITGNPVE